MALDPGIREIVLALRAADYETTDSGDGFSKTPDPDIIPFPHVAIVTRPAFMVAAAHGVRDLLIRRGFGNGLKVEATYFPEEEKAVVMVMWP